MTPQPIATAPKEMRILVYCQRAATDEGWWQIGQFDQAIGEWLDDVVDGELLLVKPICWLPLPEPCCPFFEEHPCKKDDEYDEEEHRRL